MQSKKFRAMTRLMLTTTGILLAGAAQAQTAGTFTNGGFEDGTTSGWTASGGTWAGGAVTPSTYGGAANSVTVVSQGNDPITGVPMVFAGNNAVRVNDSTNNRSINAITQSVTNYSGSNLYLAWSAVMQPSHALADAGSFNIIVEDNTTGTSLANIYYNASSDPSNAANLAQWSSAGSVVYSGWVVETLATTIGHDYTITLYASDCDAGGHFGYVYLDAFSDAPVTPNAGVNAGSSSGGVLQSGGGGSIPDIVTSSGNTVGGLGSATTRRFDGGTLAASDDTGNFTISRNGGFIDAGGQTSTFSGTFADDNSDVGHLTIQDSVGNGTIVLTGTNTHSGGTTVLAGTTLSIASASSLGTGALSLLGTATVPAKLHITGNTNIANAVNVAGDPIFDVASGVTATVSGVIADDVSGAGDVVKQGDGTLVLAAQNTYTGGTFVDAGVLQAGVANALPLAQAVTVAATGTLDLANYNQSISTLAGAGSVTLGSAALTLSQAASTFSGVISGTGALAVTGGTETLTGANTYTGGTTIGTGATVALGAGGTGGTIVGNVVDNGALRVNHSDDLTIAGAISGTGSLTKVGANVLTLTGTNTYSGGTTVSAGGLKGSTVSLQGNIVDNGSVEFAQAVDGTYAGALTGSGTLTKTGAGTLALTGVSAITGATTISGGKVSLQGQLGTSTATVNTGATLAGTGTLAGNLVVNTGGTLAPGNSPGTLTVTGNVTLNAGSSFVTEIDGRTYSAAGGAGSYDRVVVSGATSTFNPGGVIVPVLRNISGAATNTFNPIYGDRFTVATAATIGSGSFSSVQQPTTGLPTNSRFDVLYNTGNVQLVLTPGSYAALGQADGWLQDGINAAAGLDAVRPAAGVRNNGLQSLFNGLYGMGRNQLGLAFQQVSGEIHADALQAVAGTADLVGSTVREAGLGAYDNQSQSGQSHLWGQMVGRSRVGSQDAVATRYTDSAYGFLLGLSYVENGSRFGIAGGYIKGSVTNAIGGHAATDYTTLYGYGTRQISADLSVNGTLGILFGTTDTTRDLTLSTGTSTSSARNSFTALNGSVQMRYKKAVSAKATATMFAGVDFTSLTSDRIVESNADQTLALTLAQKNWDSVRSSLGVLGSLAMGKQTWFEASAAWNHALAGTPTARRDVAMGNAAWSVSSVMSRLDTLGINAGFTSRLSDSVTVKVGYAGLFDGQSYVSHSGNLLLSVKF